MAADSLVYHSASAIIGQHVAIFITTPYTVKLLIESPGFY